MPLVGNWCPKRERMSSATVRGNLENIRLRKAQMLQRFCPSWFNHAWSTIECDFCLTTQSSHVSWNAACKGSWEPSPSCYISEVQCWWFGIILYWARGQRWRLCQFGMFVFGSRLFYPTANQLLATCVPISKFSQSKSKVELYCFNILQHQSCHAQLTLISCCQDFVQQIGLLHTTAVVPKQTPHPQLFGCSVVWIFLGRCRS